MNTAIGMVATIVNVPHALSRSALTTTSPTTARRMIMISSTVTSAVKPPRVPISSRAIWPSDLPSRRIEQNRITKSCTAPPRTAPIMIHSVPGKIAELSGERRSDKRARSGDCGEVMPEEDPLVRRLIVVSVAQTFGRCGTLVVQQHHLCCNKPRIETEADEITASRRRYQPQAVHRLAANTGYFARY